jgi:YD repeat-containing protein
MNQLKKLQLFLLISLFSRVLFSQGVLFSHIDSDKIPKPNTFQEHGFLGGDLSKGQIDVSIPLYEINSDNIRVPIKLIYNSGGIKVDAISSNVGLGWSLITGGAVTRKIQDIEDNQIEELYTGNHYPNSDKYIKRIGYHMKAEDILQPNSTAKIFTDVAKIDAAPDLFFGTAPGINSKFYLESFNRGTPNDFDYNIRTFKIKFLEGDTQKGALVTRKRLTGMMSNGFFPNEIQGFPLGIGRFNNGQFPMDYKGFELTNEQGLIYTFDKPIFVESISSFSSVAQFTQEKEKLGTEEYDTTSSNARLLSSFAAGLYRLRADSWSLTNISDPNTRNSVSFSYESYNKPSTREFPTNINMKKYANGSYPNFICSLKFLPSYYDTHGHNSGYCAGCELYVKTPKHYLKTPQNNRIKQINWVYGKVIFYYGLERLDELNERALTRMEVLDVNEKVIKTYYFNYSYFISKENCNDWKCKRLRLESIDLLKGAERVKFYSFDYYDNIPLPKVNSLEQDFMGYYNNNGAIIGKTLETIKTPILYYIPGFKKNSILPFPLTNSTEISGDYSLLANEYSLTGLLKKVINPLGGSNEFEYENHDFQMYGHIFKAGGARIKTQVLNDGNNKRYIHYEYNDHIYSSSGRLINVPVFGYPYAKNESDRSGNFFISFTNKQNVGVASIDYSRVIKREVGKGATEFIFSKRNDVEVEYTDHNLTDGPYGCFNRFHDNSALGKISYFQNNDIFRSKITEKKIYDVNNNLLKTAVYNYTGKEFDSLPLNFQDSQPSSCCVNNYDNGSVTRKYATFRYNSNLKIQRNLLTRRHIMEYTPSGVIETKEDNLYLPNLNLKREVRSLNSFGKKTKTNYYYPFDLNVKSLPYMSNLVAMNKINEPVKKKVYVDGVLMGVKQVNYRATINQSKDAGEPIVTILQKSVSVAKGDNELEEGAVVINRDIQGNITEYKTVNNVYHSIIWGYNRAHPIAKLENTKLSDISTVTIDDLQAKSNLDKDIVSENTLQASLNALRTIPGLSKSQITTFTYNPLIGVTSITDPRGKTIYYEYDSFNRLQYVKDAQKNILKENKYNYKN